MARMRPYLNPVSQNKGSGRHYLNIELIPRFAETFEDGAEIIFVGVHPLWDYSPFFNNPRKICHYRTLDNNPNTQPPPDIVASIEECPSIETESIDGIIMIGVYEYLNRKAEAFAEINRVLKPTGRAVIAVPGRGYYPDKNRSVDLWEVWDRMMPMRVREVYTFYEGSLQPTSIIVVAEKGVI